MKLLDCFIPMTPTPKQRPRVGLHGNVYTPKKTQNAEMLIRYHARVNYCSPKPYNGIVKLYLEVFRHTPTRNQGDVDNYLKLVQDALNGLVYTDDRLIVDSHVVKTQIPKALTQGIYILVEAVETA